MNTDYRIGISPVSDESATDVSKEIIDGTKAKLGFVPSHIFHCELDELLTPHTVQDDDTENLRKSTCKR